MGTGLRFGAGLGQGLGFRGKGSVRGRVRGKARGWARGRARGWARVGVRLQPLSDGHAVGLLRLHAQRHGLEAAQAQPAVVWGEAAALGVLQKVDGLGQLVTLDREDACWG